MPKKIIQLDAHRQGKEAAATDVVAHYERMALAEDTLEALDDLGVSTREELVALLEKLEATAPDVPET